MPTTTPSWFIADSSLQSHGAKRQQEAKERNIATLAQIFPEVSLEALSSAVEAGGDLTMVVDRLLAAQFADSSISSGGASSSTDPIPPRAGGASGPKRRVRFRQPLDQSGTRASSVEQMERLVYDAPAKFGSGYNTAWPAATDADQPGGSMSRMSDEQLEESLDSSGMRAEPAPGSTRNAVRASMSSADASALETMLASGGLEQLRSQPIAELATGALAVHANIIKTANELEAGYVSERIVTRFVIEVRQLGIRWEVSRRYSEFYKFHDLLSLQWADLPSLPPKLLFSSGDDDVVQRMMELDAYLRALLASPAVALSPLVCTFLDAIDLHSFRTQMLPQLEYMSSMQRQQNEAQAAGSGTTGPIPMMIAEPGADPAAGSAGW